MPKEDVICDNCYCSLHLIPLEKVQFAFDKQYKNHGYLDGLLSLFYFEKDKEIHRIIHSIKYNNRFRTGIYFGRLFSLRHEEFLNSQKIDYIVPVPLHHLKKAERGYNQSEYISKGISRASGIQYCCSLVKRIRYTRSQTTLTIDERRENVKNAFSVRKRNLKKIRGKNILLFDDVITTGITVSECARALKNAGANKIFASSIALVP